MLASSEVPSGRCTLTGVSRATVVASTLPPPIALLAREARDHAGTLVEADSLAVEAARLLAPGSVRLTEALAEVTGDFAHDEPFDGEAVRGLVAGVASRLPIAEGLLSSLRGTANVGRVFGAAESLLGRKLEGFEQAREGLREFVDAAGVLVEAAAAAPPAPPAAQAPAPAPGPWDPALHPRMAKGRVGGGQFAHKGDGTEEGVSGDPNVVQLQRRLLELGFVVQPDGRYGPVTTEAVKSFQKRYGLDQTGDLDEATVATLRYPPPKTAAEVEAELAAQTADTKKGAASSAASGKEEIDASVDPDKAPAGSPAAAASSEVVQPDSKASSGKSKTKTAPTPRDEETHDTLGRGDGMDGEPDEAVKKAQEDLGALGYDLGDGGVDGRYGPATEQAVRTLQRRYGLRDSGFLDEATTRLIARLLRKQATEQASSEKPKSKSKVQEAAEARRLAEASGDTEAIVSARAREAALREAEDFTEKLHPRNRLGRWVDKPDFLGSGDPMASLVSDLKARGVAFPGETAQRVLNSDNRGRYFFRSFRVKRAMVKHGHVTSLTGEGRVFLIDGAREVDVDVRYEAPIGKPGKPMRTHTKVTQKAELPTTRTSAPLEGPMTYASGWRGYYDPGEGRYLGLDDIYMPRDFDPTRQGGSGMAQAADSPGTTGGLHDAFHDLVGNRVYRDSNGDYHYRKGNKPGGPVTPWNEEARAAFPDHLDFVRAAQEYIRPTTIGGAAESPGTTGDFQATASRFSGAQDIIDAAVRMNEDYPEAEDEIRAGQAFLDVRYDSLGGLGKTRRVVAALSVKLPDGGVVWAHDPVPIVYQPRDYRIKLEDEALRKMRPFAQALGIPIAVTRAGERMTNMLEAKSSAYPDLERVPGKQNWVDKAGGLPSYIERIAKHLHYEKGMTIGHAIATAVNTVKRWCAGGQVTKSGAHASNVTAATKAKACRAVAQWEAKKGKGKLKEALALIEQDGHLSLLEANVAELRMREVMELLAYVDAHEDEIDALGAERQSSPEGRMEEAKREMREALERGDTAAFEGARARAQALAEL